MGTSFIRMWALLCEGMSEKDLVGSFSGVSRDVIP